MNILILGLNYAPEPIGIGPYTTGMARALAAAGHCVSVVAGKPYYPHWKTDPAFAGRGYRRSAEDGVEITRCPIYVPTMPSGARRLIHHASFAATAMPVMLAQAWTKRPDVVIAIAPSLIAAPAARVAARIAGAKLWLHIQDFEVEAAFATGLMSERGTAAQIARRFEDWSLVADQVSTISPQMCEKLREKGVPAGRIVEFRNWADLDAIRPLAGPSPYHTEWGIDRRHVALYSGNLANKQGIEIVVEAAERLVHRKDLAFVVCGEGPNRGWLVASAGHLDNIRFYDLQPRERLSDLLGMATVHLLPQIAGAADLVLPSKLTNMLASGRPVVASAGAGTGLAYEVEGCGLLSDPGDGAGFAAAIEALIDDGAAAAHFGEAARARAEQRWGREQILVSFERALAAL